MKNIISLLSLLIFVIGCASSKVIIGPDGTNHQLVTCSDGIEYCYEKAKEVCGGKYKIVNTSSETGGYNGIVATDTNLLVKCTLK